MIHTLFCYRNLCIAFISLMLWSDAGARILARIDTSLGLIEAELFYQQAPQTVANFINLAEGRVWWLDPNDGQLKKEPFYNGLIFHRVIDGFMNQGGCPLGNGSSGPGYRMADEFDPSLSHTAYRLSMANSGPNTNGSQFFITAAAPTFLDGVHSVFGEATDASSRAVVLAINGVATDANDKPLTDVTINQITIVRENAQDQAFDSLAQGVPTISPMTLKPRALPNSSVFPLEVNQPAASLMQISSSIDLSNWSSFSNITRYLGPDAAANLEFDAPVDAGLPTSQFYRALRIDFSGNRLCPSSPVQKVFSFIAVNPTNTGLCYYNFTLNPDRTGTWTAYQSAEVQLNPPSNIILASGSILDSIYTPEGHGGRLIVLSNGFPFYPIWSLSLGIDTEDSGVLAGRQVLRYYQSLSLPPGFTANTEALSISPAP